MTSLDSKKYSYHVLSDSLFCGCKRALLAIWFVIRVVSIHETTYQPFCCIVGLGSVRTATKRAGGTVNNHGGSPGQRLGVKKFSGTPTATYISIHINPHTIDEYVIPGNIIMRQRGTLFHPGPHVGPFCCSSDEPGSQEQYRSAWVATTPYLRPRRDMCASGRKSICWENANTSASSWKRATAYPEMKRNEAPAGGAPTSTSTSSSNP